jgi:hypothetical protein
MQRLSGLAVVIVTALALAVAPAFAGKPGSGGGGGGSSTTGTVTVNPSPAAAYSRVTVSGCGFSAAPAILRIVSPSGSAVSYNVGMWADGCLDGAGFATGGPGTYTVQILQVSGIKRSTTTTLKASATLSVV